jgi:hypothetical protein
MFLRQLGSLARSGEAISESLRGMLGCRRPKGTVLTDQSNWQRVRVRGLKTAVLLVGTLGCCSPAMADTGSELTQWTQYYWHLQETGNPHPSAVSFQFTQPVLNQSTVFPFAGAVTLFNDIYSSKLNQDASSCAYTSVLDFIGSNEEIESDFKEYTLSKQFVTSLQDANVTLAHLLASVTLTTGTANYALSGELVIGNELVSTSGLLVTSTQVVQTSVATNVAPAVMQFGEALETVAISISASGLDVQFHPLKAIRGTQDKYVTHELIRDRLVGLQQSDFGIVPLVVAVGEAQLFTFCRVDKGEYYYLVDGGTGSVDGPFPSTSTMKTDALLASRGVSNPTKVTVVATASKCYPVAGFIPWILIPWTPGPLPTPPGTPPWVPVVLPPGTPAPTWSCVAGPLAGQCTCKITNEFIRTYPPVCVPVINWPCYTPKDDGIEQQTCTFINPGPGACAPAGPPPGTATCTTQHAWQ